MVTASVEVGAAWVKLASDTDTHVLVSCCEGAVLRLATTATDTAPTVPGHAFRLTLERNDRVTRADLGTGFVWARLDDPRFTEVDLDISK